MLEQLLNTGNCICGLSNAALSTVAKRVLTSGSTDEAASHPKITLRMCHLIKQLMTFHFGEH
jgi:hypothetical protein